MATESERLLGELVSVQQPLAKKLERGLPEIMPPPPLGTETTATVKVRTAQRFFRKVVLAAYGWRCCITGNPVPELLVASHILPWSGFPEERVNPQNGLCLAAHFDRAFDQGLITFGENMKVVLSTDLLAYLPEEAIEREFKPMEDAPLRSPERFPPNSEFLDYHRRNIFRS